MVKAHDTIDNKALDIEHEETSIVGHIYSSAFVDRAGKKLDMQVLQEMNSEELEKMDIDVMIAGILYKSRFTELAKEVKDDKWKYLLLICTEIRANKGRYLHSALTHPCREQLL